MTTATSAARVTRVEAAAYRIPTDKPESDGTFAWDATDLVTVHVYAGDVRGFGYTYGSPSIVSLIADVLSERVVGQDVWSVEAAWLVLVRAVRNMGRPGIASCAISAIDAALWDAKAKLLDLPLVRLLGDVREEAPIYGSGGFTSYDVPELCAQLAGWAADGISSVKMKVGTRPQDDLARVAAVREALGAGPSLMVDANGAYGRAEAIGKAYAFAEHGVGWFEEPVPSDDLEGLRAVRLREPPGVAVAAGEYGYDPVYFRRMLESGAVDVLQADATRCGGITGFLAASRLCQAFGVPLSAHTAPAIHAHVACASAPLLHVEWFHDHVRIERMLFDGAPAPKGGMLRPDRSRPGLGVELKTQDAEAFALHGAR